ncbi:plexin domain-containing protein 2-like isoform X3 [Acropora muricata]
MNGSEASCTNGNCTEQINHRYYVSKVISDGQRYWRDIEGHPNSITHHSLSNRFLGRQKLRLGFKFPYYGHYLDSVVLTTGGFLYMDVHKTSLITDVQYLAPLMAYFNPSLSVNSTVLTLDDGKQLTVQWRNILLHNKTNVGPFNFQCTLHKNGTIWFAYKQVPVSVDSLPDLKYHPVRVGISDAFVIFRWDPVRPIVYRFFFIYSQINITKKSVINGSAVVFYPLPSCVLGDSCAECMRLDLTTEFNCQWCPAIKRCSDTADRHRDEWDLRGCNSVSVKNISDERCVERGMSTSPPPSSPTTTGVSGKVATAKQRQSKGGIGAGAIVAIFIVLMLICCIGAWCVYAYRHPTSKSGLFLIDISRRPRELFKSSSLGVGKTGDVAPSNVKLQAL